MSESEETEGSYLEMALVYVALLVLLGATIGFAFAALSPTMSIIVALGIAAMKMLLIMAYYMHLRYRAHLVWIFASAALAWLTILFGLTLTDYLTRHWYLIET